MNPDSLARSLCERHGLPTEHADLLLPLLRKTVQAPDAVRDRILEILEANLKQVASGKAAPDKIWIDLDHEVLVAVARVIHKWTPSGEMLDFGAMIDRLGLEPPKE
jgi:hypothetical protein